MCQTTQTQIKIKKRERNKERKKVENYKIFLKNTIK